jgi:hypothetical protein
MDACLRFVPSRVDGLPTVVDATLYPDRLELRSANDCLVLWFDEIAQWPRPARLWRMLSKIRIRAKWLPVGERDWFHPPRDRYFRFFTNPPITVYMPEEPASTGYESTVFVRAQEVMRRGGFATFDLG